MDCPGGFGRFGDEEVESEVPDVMRERRVRESADGRVDEVLGWSGCSGDAEGVAFGWTLFVVAERPPDR